MTTRRLFAVLLVLATLLTACAPATTRQEPIAPAPTVRTVVPATEAPRVEAPVPTATETTPAATAVPVTQSLPDPANVTWREIAGGLEKPTDISSPGDGSGRVFVLEQPGRIRIIQNGQLIPGPYLDISNIVGANASERGLLGLAFHPNYAENGFFFVNYTDKDGHTHIARFSVSDADPNLADPGSRLELIRIEQPYGNHNGGSLAFGPDGYLYAGLGDGGSAGDPLDSGQSTNTLLGKILRFDVDGGAPAVQRLEQPRGPRIAAPEDDERRRSQQRPRAPSCPSPPDLLFHKLPPCAEIACPSFRIVSFCTPVSPPSLRGVTRMDIRLSRDCARLRFTVKSKRLQNIAIPMQIRSAPFYADNCT